MSQRKLGLFPKGPDQGDAPLGAAELAPRLVREFRPVAGAEVGQGVVFEVSPNVLGRVEFRGIGRQSRHDQLAAASLDEPRDEAAAVGRQTIPDHEQLSPDLPPQMPQEIDHLGRANAAPVEPEVEAPPGDTGHHRQLAPVEREVQVRGLSTGRPRACQRRLLAQSAFVNEDNGAAFAAALFFSAGHVWRFQRAMASSSRSLARPVGRWQLHPMRANTFQRCDG